MKNLLSRLAARLTGRQDVVAKVPPKTNLKRDDSLSFKPTPKPEIFDKARELERIDAIRSPTELEAIVLQSRYAEVRLAAVKRITDPDVLRRIASAMHDRDKRVHRHCAQFLAAGKVRQQQLKRVLDLEQSLREVIDLQPIPPGKLHALQQTLETLAASTNVDTHRELLEKARIEEHQQHAAIKAAEVDLQSALKLLTELTAEALPTVAGLDTARQQLQNLRERLTQRPGWLQAQRVAVQSLATFNEIEEVLAKAGTDAARIADCRRFLAAQATAAISKIVISAWAAMPKPAHPKARAALDAEWQALQSQARRKTPLPSRQPPKLADSDRGMVTNILEQLEAALESGNVQQAFALQRRLDGWITSPVPELGPRLQAVQERLHVLRGWQRWGAERARDELIAAAEALAAQEATPDELREAVRKLRAEWNRLGQAGPMPSDVRARFDGLLRKAYEPVLRRRQEQEARQAEARQRHWQKLDEWEAWWQSIDWNVAQGSDVQRRWDNIRQERRQLPRLIGKDARQSASRFAALRAEINARIAPLVQEEIERRERLISQANGLLSGIDLGEAVRQMRVLQRRWREETLNVRLPHRDHERLWKTLRQAADALFARRDEERAARVSVAAAAREERQQMLARLEMALGQASTIRDLDAAMQDFETTWSTTPANEPSHDLRQRAEQLRDVARQKRRNLATQAERNYFDVLAAKALLIESVENAAANGQSYAAAMDEAEGRWNRLSGLPTEAERALRQRLQDAPRVTVEQVSAGHFLRTNALLDLEIFLGLPSPEDCAGQRRRRQLTLLQQEGRGTAQSDDIRRSILRWYSTAALADPAHNERMSRILEAFLVKSN